MYPYQFFNLLSILGKTGVEDKKYIVLFIRKINEFKIIVITEQSSW